MKLFPHFLIAVGFLILIGSLIFSRFATNIKNVVYEKDHSAELFGTLIDKTVAENARILNWEWEIEFYSDRPYVHPHFELFQALVNLFYNRLSSPILDQRRIPEDIDYVIIGPMARITEVFEVELSQRETKLVIEIGPYQLWKLGSSVESGTE